MKSAAHQVQDTTGFPLLGNLRESWRQGYFSPLARRFVIITIGCSSILAVLMTGIQLYVDFRSERSVLIRSVEDVKKTLVPGLVESLWVIDETLVRSQLEGIVQIEGVEYVEIVDPDGQKTEAGEGAGTFGHHYEYPIERDSGSEAVFLGTLHLFVSFDAIIDRVIKRAVLIFFTNVMKTLVVAAVILLIYQMLIGRHIAKLASFASTYDPQNPPPPLVLDREPASSQDDELAKLKTATNHLLDANRSYIEKLQDAMDAVAASHRDLDATNKKLHLANQEQAEFTYAISHDLKSPAVSVGMLLDEIWEESHERLDSDTVEMFKRAQHLIDRMGRQVESVLDYSKTITKDFDFETVDLNQTLAHAVDDLSGAAKKAGASIEVSDLPLVDGNASFLSMLFLNLLSNALKFRDPNRAPKIVVGTKPSEQPETVCIAVHDNGIGIAKDHHEQIFGLFKRLHLQSAYPGSGIGLALCQRIVTKHEGTIEVESDIGQGTTFRVNLRRSEADSATGKKKPFHHAIRGKTP